MHLHHDYSSFTRHHHSRHWRGLECVAQLHSVCQVQPGSEPCLALLIYGIVDHIIDLVSSIVSFLKLVHFANSVFGHMNQRVYLHPGYLSKCNASDFWISFLSCIAQRSCGSSLRILEIRKAVLLDMGVNLCERELVGSHIGYGLGYTITLDFWRILKNVQPHYPERMLQKRRSSLLSNSVIASFI